MLWMHTGKIKMNIFNQAVDSQKKIMAEGFKWPDSTAVISKVREELLELSQAIEKKNLLAIEEEFGDLLLVMTNLSIHLDLDIQECLTKSLAKFNDRYKKMLTLAREEQSDFALLTLEQKKNLWKKIKN